MITDKQKELIKNLSDVKKSTKSRIEYNTYQQMLTRIRKFGHGAVDDLLYLTDELPEAELKKVFTNNQIKELLKIILKSTKDIKRPAGALSLDALTGEITREFSLEEKEELKRFEELESILQRLIPQLQGAIMREKDLVAQAELLKEYGSFANLQAEILVSRHNLQQCISSTSLLTDFIRGKGQTEEYEAWKESTLRRALKESGLTEERIDSYLKKGL